MLAQRPFQGDKRWYAAILSSPEKSSEFVAQATWTPVLEDDILTPEVKLRFPVHFRVRNDREE